MRNAVEQRNTEMMFGPYADDATFRCIEYNTSSSRMKLHGQGESADLGVTGAVVEDAALPEG